MGLPGFSYKTITKSDETSEVGSIMAYRFSEKRTLQAVLWHTRRKMWMYAPAIGIGYLNDFEYMDRTEQVDRPTAERIAQDLGIELPSEEALTAMCEEGERMGWKVGPPEQD